MLLFLAVTFALLLAVARIPHVRERILVEYHTRHEQALSWIHGLDLFKVSQVEIRGTRILSPDDIFRKLGVADTLSIWAVPRDSVRKRAELIPGIERARLHRSLPATLVLSIQESPPVAYVLIPNGRFIVTRSGDLIQPDSLFSFDSLPLMKLEDRAIRRGRIHDERVREIARSLFMLQNSDVPWLQAIRTIEPLADSGFSITLSEPYDTEVFLPVDASPRTLALFDVVWRDFNENHAVEGRAIRAIDLRFSDQAVVRY